MAVTPQSLNDQVTAQSLNDQIINSQIDIKLALDNFIAALYNPRHPGHLHAMTSLGPFSLIKVPVRKFQPHITASVPPLQSERVPLHSLKAPLQPALTAASPVFGPIVSEASTASDVKVAADAKGTLAANVTSNVGVAFGSVASATSSVAASPVMATSAPLSAAALTAIALSASAAARSAAAAAASASANHNDNSVMMISMPVAALTVTNPAPAPILMPGENNTDALANERTNHDMKANYDVLKSMPTYSANGYASAHSIQGMRVPNAPLYQHQPLPIDLHFHPAQYNQRDNQYAQHAQNAQNAQFKDSNWELIKICPKQESCEDADCACERIHGKFNAEQDPIFQRNRLLQNQAHTSIQKMAQSNRKPRSVFFEHYGEFPCFQYFLHHRCKNDKSCPYRHIEEPQPLTPEQSVLLHRAKSITKSYRPVARR